MDLDVINYDTIKENACEYYHKKFFIIATVAACTNNKFLFNFINAYWRNCYKKKLY